MEGHRHIAILVAAQHPGWFPADEIYLPIQAGAALASPAEGLIRDDTGDNISPRNRGYCELTALYWAWKNLDADYIGLNHYRRFFSGRVSRDKRERIASGEQIAQALGKAPILLPKPRNYFIETNYSQYVHAHHAQDLALTEAILAEKFPEYLDAYRRVMARTWGHRFNMLVMRRDILDRYCQWLFAILFELESRLDTSGYSTYDQRVFGFVAERLLDVWLEQEKLPSTQLGVVFLGQQNWLKKGGAFLMRKLQGGKNTHESSAQ